MNYYINSESWRGMFSMNFYLKFKFINLAPWAIILGGSGEKEDSDHWNAAEWYHQNFCRDAIFRSHWALWTTCTLSHEPLATRTRSWPLDGLRVSAVLASGLKWRNSRKKRPNLTFLREILASSHVVLEFPHTQIWVACILFLRIALDSNFILYTVKKF